MRNNSVVIEEEPAAPISPDMLGKLKKDDMKQAIVERFKVAAPARTATRERKRSPYWQAADEEC
jgi:hypothetical protein